MDIMLEGYMNGIQDAEKIKEELNIQIIFLTALNDDETFLTAANIRSFGYISKPFRPEQV